jgi:hypothetical protein
MTMKWIRKQYGVPAKRGGLVRMRGSAAVGQIVSARGSLLRVSWRHGTETSLVHPELLLYLGADGSLVWPEWGADDER